MIISGGKVSGVYAIRNKVNGKVYVGSGVRQVKYRGQCHRSELRHGIHGNYHLQQAWNHYGSDAFEFLILEECPPEQCLVREQHWIDTLDATNQEKGYNICPVTGNCFGKQHTDEAKAKMSASRRGKKLSDAHKAAISEGLMGLKCRPESIAKREATKQESGTAGMKGKKHTDEWKAVMSTVQKGKPKDPESIAKRTATRLAKGCCKGRKLSKEELAKRKTTRVARGLDKETGRWAKHSALASQPVPLVEIPELLCG